MRFKELERYVDEGYARRDSSRSYRQYERERERQFSRRMLEMNTDVINTTPDFILKNGDIWILPKEKGGKGGKNE